MKTIISLFFIGILALAGCVKREITENEFAVIWQKYLQREFEESFDEKQSISQKEKIMAGVLSEYGINLDAFKLYMKKNHKQKYQKIFSLCRQMR